MTTKATNSIPLGSVTRKHANKISKDLRDFVPGVENSSENYATLLDEAQRWRAQHALPTENCFHTLLEYSKEFDGPVLSFRLKRMKSILNKLKRPGTNYQLGTLDDIGGCRLILKDMQQVNAAIDLLSEKFMFKQGNNHIKNYIERPRDSGYRSCHLITMNQGEDREYRVEVQIRTQLQHLWSTAVEAAGVIYETDLKTEKEPGSASGTEAELREFFRLVSSLFSLEEGTPQVGGLEASRDGLVSKLQRLPHIPRLLDDLESANDGVFVIEDEPMSEGSSGLYLMTFDIERQELGIRFFDDGLEEALDEYDRHESSTLYADPTTTDSAPYMDVLLAYAQSGEQLRLAYPNYSTRVEDFVMHIRSYLPPV